MQGQQIAYNRQMTLQLMAGDTAVPLTDHVILKDHAQSTTVIGQDAVIDSLRAFFLQAFADTAVEINTLLADGKTTALSLLLSGRQVAPFWGLPCAGRHVTLSLVMICRFQADHIAAIELYYDGGTLLRQLGLAL